MYPSVAKELSATKFFGAGGLFVFLKDIKSRKGKCVFFSLGRVS